jgi:hypothetical protein
MAISDIHTTAPTGLEPGPPCNVCNTLASLDESEADALRSLLADPSWRYQELSDRLAAEGVTLSYQSLSRHARGRCLAREKLRGA